MDAWWSRVQSTRSAASGSRGQIAVITTDEVGGRNTVDARGLVVAPGFIDLHDPGQTRDVSVRSLDGVTTTMVPERRMSMPGTASEAAAN